MKTRVNKRNCLLPSTTSSVVGAISRSRPKGTGLSDVEIANRSDQVSGVCSVYQTEGQWVHYDGMMPHPKGFKYACLPTILEPLFDKMTELGLEDSNQSDAFEAALWIAFDLVRPEIAKRTGKDDPRYILALLRSDYKRAKIRHKFFKRRKYFGSSLVERLAIIEFNASVVLAEVVRYFEELHLVDSTLVGNVHALERYFPDNKLRHSIMNLIYELIYERFRKIESKSSWKARLKKLEGQSKAKPISRQPIVIELPKYKKKKKDGNGTEREKTKG